MVNYESRTSPEILEQCSSNLAPQMYIMIERKWHLWSCCHDNSFAAGPVLITIEIPSFGLNQVPSTPSNLMRKVKTIWEPCLFWARPSVALKNSNADLSYWVKIKFLKKGLEMGIIGFDRKRLEPRELPWQWHHRCHFVSHVMYILKITAPKLLEISLIQYFTILVAHFTMSSLF